MQRFMRRPKRVLLRAALAAALCLASAGVGRADSQLYQGLLHSTGLIEAPAPDGSVTYGACWVVDRQSGLALTTRHVVGDAAEAVVYFPAYRDGAAVTEMAYYHRQVAAVRGRVVYREVGRDLALLRLDALPDHVRAIPLAAQSAGPGDAVHSVGNSGVLEGVLWRYTAGTVRSVHRAQLHSENSEAEARIVETQSPINPGDSGGPLVNDRGELVGVVMSLQEQTSLVSFNVDVQEVKAFLGDAFWHEVNGFLGDAVRPNAQPSAGAPGADRESPAVRGAWKLTLITLEGEQLPGECRFEADGTFALSVLAADAPQTLPGRYSYANGVLLMAGDRFEVRRTPHWVKDRRFTVLPGTRRLSPYPAAGMLIFDRRPDAEGAAAPPLPGGPAVEHSPRMTEKTSEARPPTDDQPVENAPGGPLPSGQVHPGEEPSTSWVIASLLMGAACGFLLLAVTVSGRRNSTKGTRAMSWEVKKDDPRALFQDRRQTRV
jgi:S1-C subfamily serine protease